MFFAIYGTWEARASRKHTNLARRIDPPTPKYLKNKKTTEEIRVFQNHISGPVCYKIPFFNVFLKKLISYGSSSQNPLWKWIVNGSSSLGFGRSENDLMVFWTSNLTSCWKVLFHFKPSRYEFSLGKVRAGLLYFQNMVVIFSKHSFV